MLSQIRLSRRPLSIIIIVLCIFDGFVIHAAPPKKKPPIKVVKKPAPKKPAPKKPAPKKPTPKKPAPKRPAPKKQTPQQVINQLQQQIKKNNNEIDQLKKSVAQKDKNYHDSIATANSLIDGLKKQVKQHADDLGLSHTTIQDLTRQLETLKNVPGQQKPSQKTHDSFAIVTLSTPNRAQFANLIENNQRQYALLHEYDYIKYKNTLDPSRPEEWSKIKALREQMDKSNADWLLWIDDDIVITNPAICLSYFLRKYGKDKNLIIAKDAHYQKGVPINNGIFLIRNSAWGKDFLDRVWTEGAKRNYLTRGTSLLEQQTMTDLMNEQPNLRNRIQVIDQREMNSFLRNQAHYQDPEESKWKPGDFAAHVTGAAPEERTRIIKALLDQGDKPSMIPITG